MTGKENCSLWRHIHTHLAKDNEIPGKAQQVTDHIRTTAEAVGNYLSEYAQDIKQGAIKTIATFLAAATLMGGMTGCDSGSDTSLPIIYQPFETRHIEEIQESGITAEDVLGAYEAFFLTLLGTRYPDHKEYWGKKWQNKQSHFIEIAVCNYPVYDPDTDSYFQNPEPFYVCHLSYSLSKSWLPGSSDLPPLNNIYVVKIAFAHDIFGYNDLSALEVYGISKSDFDAIMNAYGKESFLIDLNNFPIEYQDYVGWADGMMGYEPFTINRDVILNSDEKQLWALYAALYNSIIPINLYAQEPQQNVTVPDLSMSK